MCTEPAPDLLDGQGAARTRLPAERRRLGCGRSPATGASPPDPARRGLAIDEAGRRCARDIHDQPPTVRATESIIADEAQTADDFAWYRTDRGEIQEGKDGRKSEHHYKKNALPPTLHSWPPDDRPDPL